MIYLIFLLAIDYWSDGAYGKLHLILIYGEKMWRIDSYIGYILKIYGHAYLVMGGDKGGDVGIVLTLPYLG